MSLMICLACNGKKIVRGIGNIRRKCENCDGTGILKNISETPAQAVSYAVPADVSHLKFEQVKPVVKRGRKTKAAL